VAKKNPKMPILFFLIRGIETSEIVCPLPLALKRCNEDPKIQK